MNDTFDAAMANRTPADLPRRIVFGFIAGFLATLIFHQLSLWLLLQLGIAPFAPFQMKPTPPFGVPAMISLAFWGGIWGIVFAYICGAFPRGIGYWILAAVFGGIAPSLVALLIVLPLKGLPMGGGWGIPLLVTAFVINAAWGIGTGLFLGVLTRWFGGRGAAAA